MHLFLTWTDASDKSGSMKPVTELEECEDDTEAEKEQGINEDNSSKSDNISNEDIRRPDLTVARCLLCKGI